MDISVIIPTYNRLARLRCVLAALEQQTTDHTDFEVIVVSDGSTDHTNTYLQNWQTPLQLRSILQPNRGVAAARNAGIAQARADFVLFLDDDVVPDPELIAAHANAHAAHGANTAVLGPMLTPRNAALQPWIMWEQAMLMKQYAAMQQGCWVPSPRQFYTGNASLARHHVVEVGGFSEDLRRAEDVELAYRLANRGVRFVFHPAAIGYHYAERSFASWMQTPYVYGRNDVQFAQQRQQNWLLPLIFEEFSRRSMLVQHLVRRCVDHRAMSAGVICLLRMIAEASARCRHDRVAQCAFSGIFNLQYYQGIADALGGRSVFLQRAAHARMRTLHPAKSKQ